jgi:5'-3' exonuclease
MSAPRAWLIDASIYIFRAWFSLPDRWHSPEGYPLNAVYGYAGFLLDFLRATGAAPHTAAAFDESLGTCFRNELCPEYKASRVLPDETLAFQLDTCRELTELLGIPSFASERYEADDYLAALAQCYREQGCAITVVTRDKDLGQLLRDEHDQWWDFAADRTLDRAGFHAKHGVWPQQFADYLALVGDAIDDIPGVPGIGAKTAAALLAAYPSLAELEANIAQVSDLKLRGAKRVQTQLQEHWPQVQLARQLTGFDTEQPPIAQAPVFTLQREHIEAFTARLNELEIGRVLGRRVDQLAQELAL